MTSSLHHTSLASMPAAGRADWVDGWGLRCALPLDAATGCWCQHPAAAVGRECRWYDDLRTVRTASRRGDWVLVPAPSRCRGARVPMVRRPAHGAHCL